MLVPNIIFSKLVYTEGEHAGEITEEWDVAFSQLFTQLQTNFSNEGLVPPSQPSSSPNNFARIAPNALQGTLLFDETNDALNVRLQDGNFHPLQIAGIAVLVINGTPSDISATRVGQTVTIDLINTAVTPGTYTYPSTVTVDQKGRITNIVSSSLGPVLSVVGTTNEINVSTVAGVATVSIANNPIIPGTGSITVPEGTTAQRPTPTNGLRYNSDLNVYELYYPTIPAWQTIDVSGGTVTGVFGTANQITVTPSSPNPTVSIVSNPIIPGLTASRAVITDSSGALQSLQYTSSNTVSTIVSRDSSGNFSAGTITATLNGNITVAGTAANITFYPVIVDNTLGATAPLISTTLTINPSTGTLGATNLSISGNSTLGTVISGAWNGSTIGVGYGGTGLATTPTNGQLLIGNGANYTLSTLTAGSGVSISNGSGSITISATGTGGTVTSLTAGTGITLTPSTITTTGSIALTIPVVPSSGGTGTTTVFTQGSVIFAGASGIYSQDNANFFWDATNHRLGIGTSSPSYQFHAIQPAGSNLYIDAATNPKTYGFGAIQINMKAGTTGTKGIYVDMNAAGNGDTHGFNIDFVSGAQANTESHMYEANLDASAAAATAKICSLSSFVSSPGAPSAILRAIQVNPYFDAIEQNSGTFGASTQSWSFSSSTFTSITTGTHTIFPNNGDDVYVGSSSTFNYIIFTLSTLASSTLNNQFRYWNGSSWHPFFPKDGTSGFQDNGVIAWDLANIPGWTTTSVNSVSAYYIRITRQASTVTTVPIETAINIASTTLYLWDKSGNVNLNTLALASPLTGTNGGTGVNNGSNTITLGGNISTAGALTTSGAFGVTFTFTGTTNVTFPTSGTLSTTTGTVTSITAGTGLTGGTITSSGTIALSVPVSVANGGTGTTTAFTAGSVVFAGASGVYSQDNSNFFWDGTNHRLGIGLASPSYQLQIKQAAGDYFYLDASTNNKTAGIDDIYHIHTSGGVGTRAVFMSVNNNSFSDTKAIAVNYATSTTIAGQEYHVLDVDLNATSMVANSKLTGISLSANQLGSGIVRAVQVNPTIDVIEQNSGTFANGSQCWYFNGSTYTSITTGSHTVFSNNGDIVYIGSAAIFNVITIVLSTNASLPGILGGTFQYWNGSAWTNFQPSDGTNGFTTSGTVSFPSGSLSGWASTSVNSVSAFYVRITRSNSASITAPVETSIQVSATTQYLWDKSGNVNFNNITLADVANGTPGSHIAAAPAPSGSTNYWFIPMDPNNASNKISSSSPIAPRSVRILLKNLVITGATSSVVMRVATASGSGVATNNYGGTGIFTTTNTGAVTNQNNNINTQPYIFIMTGTTLSTSTGAGRGLTGFLDINWYIPGSGNGQLNVNGMVGCYDNGNNLTQQVIYGFYDDTVANLNNIIGVSFFLTGGGSPLFGSTCSADVVMQRL